MHEFIQGLGVTVDSLLHLGKKEVGGHVYQITKRHPLRSTDTVVDLGAHIGAFTVFASRIADKGHVLCI